MSLSDYQTEADARNLTASRLDAVLRVADASSGQSTGIVDENVSAAKSIKRTITNATYTHANVTTEEDVLELLTLNNDVELNMDATLLTQNATVRVREKVDGITYEIIQEAVYPTDFDGTLISVGMRGKGRDMKVTLQSAALETATRDIPHSRIEILTAV